MTLSTFQSEGDINENQRNFQNQGFQARRSYAFTGHSDRIAYGVATMEKLYNGKIEGRSATLFSASFDPATGKGAYCAMESFKGSLNGKRGTFNFIHSAATSGKERTSEFFSIVEGSGTGDLREIAGSGGMRIDPDNTHHIWFDVTGL